MPVYDYLASFLPTAAPAFPLPSLPGNIQARLLSFLLTRSIGPYLRRPIVQDDVASDLRNGSVQLSNVDLAPEAINAMLAELPVRCSSGSIESVRATVATPLSLSSTCQLEIATLRLDLEITQLDNSFEMSEYTQSVPRDDLDESVLSIAVAQEFVQEELSPADQTALEDSIYDEGALPGDFHAATASSDTPSTSMLARVIENVLARLGVEVRDICVTLRDGETATMLKLESVTVSSANASENLRTIAFAGLQVQMKTPLPSHTSMQRQNSSSSSSFSSSESTSSSDETTYQSQMVMSRAIADLRESTTLTAESSSVYASAIGGSAFARPNVQNTFSNVPPSQMAADADDPFVNPDQLVDDGVRTLVDLPSFKVTIEHSAASESSHGCQALTCEVSHLLIVSSPRHIAYLHRLSGCLYASANPKPVPAAKREAQSISIRADVDRLDLRLLYSDTDATDRSLFDMHHVLQHGAAAGSGSYLALELRRMQLVSVDDEMSLTSGGVSLFSVADGGRFDIISPLANESIWRKGATLFEPMALQQRPSSRKQPSRSESALLETTEQLRLLKTALGPVHVRVPPLQVAVDLDHLKTVLSKCQGSFAHFLRDKESSSEEQTSSTPRAGTPTQETHDTRVSSFFVELSVLRLMLTVPAADSRRAPSTLLVDCYPSTVTQSLLTFDMLRFGLGAASSDRLPCLAVVRSGSEEPRSDDSPRCLIELVPTAERLQCTTVKLALLDTLVKLEKAHFDALQLCADDLLRSSAALSESTADVRSAERLVGSRYFGGRSSVRRTTSDSNESDMSEVPSKFAIDVLAPKVHLAIALPSSDGSDGETINLVATNLSLDVDILGDSKGRTRVQVEIADLLLSRDSQQSSLRVLSRTIGPAPMLKLDLHSFTEPGTTMKESRIDLSLVQFALRLDEDVGWMTRLQTFARAPEGAFEGVVPNELTKFKVTLTEGSVLLAPAAIEHKAVAVIGQAKVSTNLMPDLPRTAIAVELKGFSMLGSEGQFDSTAFRSQYESASTYWRHASFVPMVEVDSAEMVIKIGNGSVLPDSELLLERPQVRLTLCADTLDCLKHVAAAMQAQAAPSAPQAGVEPPNLSDSLLNEDRSLTRSAIETDLNGPPDLLDDNVPTNAAFLPAQSASKATTSGSAVGRGELISDINGETIRLFRPEGVVLRDGWLSVPRLKDDDDIPRHATKHRIRLSNASVSIQLHEGFDWPSTRRRIEERARAIRRKLERIRQLLASGQTADDMFDEASVTMLGSVQLGLPADAAGLSDEELLALVDEELDDTASIATGATWDTLESGSRRGSIGRRTTPKRRRRRQLVRSRDNVLDIKLSGLSLAVDQYTQAHTANSRLALSASSLEILDNFPSSTWRKFLSELRPSEGGLVRQSNAPMLQVEVLELPGSSIRRDLSQLNVKAKMVPLRLYVDQDALDFMKQLAAFDSTVTDSSKARPDELFFQRFEVFPVKIKLDYKPKRVDFDALRKGRTAELMNFFHFDGSEMTLRHLVLTGISGSTRLSTMIRDIWTPDVKANQLSDVVAGIAPVRSVVNVGTGVANLVLLPIEQYKKDGRIIRGVQKGAKEFAKTTTLEALNVGARLATGTQVILEKAEAVFGGGFADDMTLEPVPDPVASSTTPAGQEESGQREQFSRYAGQPQSVKEGVRGAYESLGANLRDAAQTILAVPMEVYERSGNEGSVRAVVRAVPVAVLRPMIGATEAVSKTLFGIRNTINPDAQAEAADKYKTARSQDQQ